MTLWKKFVSLSGGKKQRRLPISKGDNDNEDKVNEQQSENCENDYEDDTDYDGNGFMRMFIDKGKIERMEELKKAIKYGDDDEEQIGKIRTLIMHGKLDRLSEQYRYACSHHEREGEDDEASKEQTCTDWNLSLLLNYACRLGCKRRNKNRLNRINVVKYLVLEEKVDVNWNLNTSDDASTTTTPLHYACKSGSLEMYEFLISQNAHVNVTDSRGWAPFHYACKYGNNAKLVRRMMTDHVAAVDVNATHPKYGSTALHLAAH